MLLIIPVSRSDKQLIPNAEKAFELFPPGNGHSLLVVGSPNVAAEMGELSGLLSKYFTGSGAYLLDHDSFLGWPGACNYAFQQTCFHLRGQGPWLWFELDATPIKENWLSTIEEAYKSGSSRFMGCLERTYRGFNGELLSEEDGGKHMAACGVYPPDAADTIVPLKGVSETDIPWWSFLQWYIAPFCSHTNLIQNNYKTENYRVEKTITDQDGERCYLNGEKRVGHFLREIICDSCNNTAWDNHYNNRISHDAVLVHGCKDGSLLEMLTPQIKCQVPTESEAASLSEAFSQLKELGAEQKTLPPEAAKIIEDNFWELTKPDKPEPRSYRRKRKKVRGLVPVLTDE